MKILKSKKGIPIPTLFFITDKEEIKDIPKGVPYFLGQPNTEEYIITILEFEVLYQKAISTGYPFNFKEILMNAGYYGIEDSEDHDIKTSLGLNDHEDISDNKLIDNKEQFIDFIIQGNYYVDISIIKSLNVFPVWMNTLEEAVSANIHKFATFDTNMYNKKLEGMYGGMILNSPEKNLIIIDISSSIPKQVSSTCLTLAKNMSESFYADILITGSKSTLYEYENIHLLDINTIYDQNGSGNEQVQFLNLLTKSERSYNTAIVFGDDDYPGETWGYSRNYYDVDQGRYMNNWKVNNLINLHTKNRDDYVYRGLHIPETIAGYGRWFTPDSITHIPNWVKDLS